MDVFFNVLLVILVIAVVVLAVLYFLGRKMEKRQVEQQSMMEAAKQVVSILVIDKKKLKAKDSGLPKMVTDQVPWYMKRAKFPIVKAKIGPKVTTLIADERVFLQLPVKQRLRLSSAVSTSQRSKACAAAFRPFPRKKDSSPDLRKIRARIQMREKKLLNRKLLPFRQTVKEEALLLYPDILNSRFGRNASSFITACLRLIL